MIKAVRYLLQGLAPGETATLLPNRTGDCRTATTIRSKDLSNCNVLSQELIAGEHLRT